MRFRTQVSNPPGEVQPFGGMSSVYTSDFAVRFQSAFYALSQLTLILEKRGKLKDMSPIYFQGPGWQNRT